MIAGSAKGVRLTAPGSGTRPLADRVKQTLFAILEPELEGASILDLFAGSGAGGIEALSRGAARAVFVDLASDATRVIADNLRRAGLAERGSVVRRDALSWLADPLAAAADDRFDLILVDPPYAETALLGHAIELAGIHLAPAGTLIAKHFWRDTPPARIGLLASVRQRRFGETAITFYRHAAAAEGPPGEEASGS